MPELPEVEVTRLGLMPVLPGLVLESVRTSGKALRSFTGSAAVLQPLRHQRLQTIARRAKQLIFVFERHLMSVHLGMSGVLQWRGVGVSQDRVLAGHDHVAWRFQTGELVLNDPRRFGDVRLLVKPTGFEGSSEAGLAQLPADWLGHAASGLEPLSADFHGGALFQAARGVRQAIKVWLMRGDVVVGVGNIYASEALYRAGISPRRAAGRISRQKMDRLAQTIAQVLQEAIDQGGSTLRDFHGADGQPGRYGQAHQVYGREGLPCLACGQAIRRLVQAQRATFFCPSCQRG
ncbi:MAG: bifunctional DNA-formamidopyrimidine glycosylase/DNA-(apurinic or apyrimidinic site) lyase [Burkholderiaceae bacterium]